MTRVFWIAFVLAVTVFAQTRSAPKSAAAHARAPAAAGRVAAPDAQVEKAIRARFATSKIAADQFKVHVQGGVATIEGRSDVIQHKGTATRLAKNAGALRVVNKVELSQAAKDKANANLAKGRRRAQVKRGDPRSDANKAH